MWQDPVKTRLELQPAVLQVGSQGPRGQEVLLPICPVLTLFHSIYHSLSGPSFWPVATIVFLPTSEKH